ncbi:MAG: single-stranded-DNA-specific exonuclease RecJ [Spirochaetota bacterium]
MKWNKTDIEKDSVRSIAGKYGVDLLTASILVRRGVTEPEQIKFYLENDLMFSYNPFLFTEMEDAVDRIQQAVAEGEKVKIFGDRDVDGITSTVLLKEELQKLGVDAEWALPLGNDPYGLTVEVVEEFAAADGELLITVDCGISNIAEITRARELGIDTIVIDHHNPQDELPPAIALIDPKIADSGYPFRDLAGCGVVAKLIWALEFSQTEMYKEELVLLHARPGNDTVILEAVKISNLVEVDRLSENLVPGMVRPDQTRLAAFLMNTQILVYDEQQQRRLLQKVFGNGVDINVLDVAPEIWKLLPKLERMSLLKIRDRSRANRYTSELVSEIDIFLSLFQSYVLRRYPALSTEFDKHLDLVALGTLADLMPLHGENRLLVKRGMRQLNAVERAGIHQLLLQQRLLGKQLSTTDVGWQISPAINATGRLGVPDKAAELLITDDAETRQRLAEEVLGLNKERKKLGDAAWKKILPKAQRSFDELNGQMVLVKDNSIHRGITGILAARLVQFFGVPATVVADLQSHLVGSMRSIKGFHLKGFLYNFEDIFIDYGGHDYAAGFSLEHERFEEFRQRFSTAVAELKPQVQEEDVLEIDAELPADYLNPDLHKLVEQFEPYGEDNPPIIFLTRRLKISNIDLVGKGEQQHAKLLLDSGGYKWPAIFWRAGERVNRDFSLGDTVDVVFRLGRNYFQNTETSQLTILDIKRD